MSKMDNSLSQSVKVLVVGAEGTGKHDISSCLTYMGRTVNIKVLTSSRLPLPDDCECRLDDVQFVCFMMCTSNKNSMKVLIDSLGKVDVSFFLGKSAIIANTKEHKMDDSEVCSQLSNLSASYDTQILYVDTEDEADKTELCRKLMRKIECVVGLKTNVFPSLFDCVQMPNTWSNRSQISTVATPAHNLS